MVTTVDAMQPAVPFDQYKLVVPIAPTPLPQGRAQRISVNSFGIGGTNAHAILESWNPSQGSPIVAEPVPQLLLFSANTEASLASQRSQYREYLHLRPSDVQNVAYTRALRRQHLTYRSFSVVQPDGELVGTAAGTKTPVSTPPVTMVFSGQGAQWPEMGKELALTNAEFRKDLDRMDAILQGLAHPPKWSLIGTFCVLSFPLILSLSPSQCC